MSANLATDAVVTDAEISPDNPETRRIRALIGKPLTRVEFFQTGTVFFEFEPYGSITVRPNFEQVVHVSVSRKPAKTGTGLAESSAEPKTGSQTIE